MNGIIVRIKNVTHIVRKGSQKTKEQPNNEQEKVRTQIEHNLSVSYCFTLC